MGKKHNGHGHGASYGTHIKKIGYGIMHIDGGAAPTNPGPAGIGIVVKLAGKEHILSRAVGVKTSNQAEYMALVVGAKFAFSLGAHGVDIYTDSKLIMHQMKNDWYVKEPTLIWYRHQARALLDGLFERHWEIIWVPRGDNQQADELCSEAIRCNNPWVPNFKDPFFPPRQKFAQFTRNPQHEAALPMTQHPSRKASLQKEAP